MNNLNPFRRRSALALCGGFALALTTLAPLRADETNPKPWTSIGAAGSPVLGTFTYQNGVAFLTSASGIMRYNVVAVDGLRDTDGPGPSIAQLRLRARFRDPDAASRVTVALRRMRISDGFTANVPGVSLDSNNFPVSAGPQTRQTVCASTQLFDFINYVYYVEVILIRAQGSFAPSIDALQLGWDDDPCLAP